MCIFYLCAMAIVNAAATVRSCVAISTSEKYVWIEILDLCLKMSKMLVVTKYLAAVDLV
jgi:hypothetical protein